MKKIIFDCESTGVDVNKDRIVQLAFIVTDDKWNVSMKKNILINPQIPIPKEASAVHGIEDKHVAESPTFKGLALALKKLFEDKQLGGFNILNFDLPLLANEFDRAGVEVNFSKDIIDGYKIEYALQPRTLSDVYRRLTGNNLDNAHDALADASATLEILFIQDNIRPKDRSMQELSGSTNLVDFTGKLTRNDNGEIVFNFGKNKGKRLKDEKDYCQWMLKSDFSNELKNIIQKEIK